MSGHAKKETITGTGAGAWLKIDPNHDVTFAVTLASEATAEYAIEVCLNPDNTVGNAAPLADLSGLTADLPPQTLEGPIHWIRINVASITGSLDFEVLAKAGGR